MKKREHRSVPYNRIVKMWNDGKSYAAIAKNIKRFDPKSDDPTKPTRAIVSRMLTVGFTDENGKTVKLKPRQGMRAIGVGKLVAKPKAVAKMKTKKTSKTASKSASSKTARRGPTPAIIVALNEDGKFISVKVGKQSFLTKTEKAKPQLVSLLNELGYDVTAKPADATPATEPEVPASGTTTEPAADAGTQTEGGDVLELDGQPTGTQAA